MGVGEEPHAPAASTPGKDLVPIVQEAGWAPGPVWMGGKSRPHRDSILDCPYTDWASRPTRFQSNTIEMVCFWGLSKIWTKFTKPALQNLVYGAELELLKFSKDNHILVP